MAATTTPTPRQNGFDFAALTASAGQQDRADEVTRLREALETLAELVIAHGVMDARTLQSIVGDLILPPMVPVSLAAPLPPPAPSAAEALLRGPLPKPVPVAARPVAKAAPAAKTMAMPAPASAAVAAPVAPVAAPVAPIAAPVAPIAAPVAPIAAPVAPIAAPVAPIAAPVAPVAAPVAPVAAPVAPVAAPVAPVAAPVAVAAPSAPTMMPSAPVVVPPPAVQPVVASPFPSEPAPAPAPIPAPAPAAARAPVAASAPARRSSLFDAREAARLEAELTETPPPALKPAGFFGRLFGRGKASPAAVAKSAASVEFTERMPKLPFDGLYSEQQRATELSFPPAASIPKRTRPAAAPARKKARPADAGPARFCDRCWRRTDASGTCKTCSPSASA